MDRTGKIDQAARKVKAEIAQEERLSKAAAVSEEQKQNLRNTCRIECKDIRLLLPQEITDVKAVITDPPYPSEFLPLFEDLAKLCINVPVVAVMSGQNWFPFAMGLLCRHLKYRWLLSYLTPGKTYDAKDRGMASTWKPILLFGEKIKNNVRDVYVSAVPDKEYHEWGQSLSGMMDIVSCLTEPGDLVLDPFVGGGATAEACVRLNRRFIGYDIDQNFVDKSWNRCLIASEEMKKEAQSDNRQV